MLFKVVSFEAHCYLGGGCYVNGAQNADVYTDFNGLAKLKNQARQDSPEALKEVAKQFESIFLNNVLKSMREAKLADGVMDNDQSKFYNDMYDHAVGRAFVGFSRRRSG